MMRISLDSPALIAVRNWLAGSQSTQRGRSGSRMASRPTFRAEQLEPRTMLDAGMRAFLPDLADESDTGSSTVDNLTYDRTPILSGSVQGAASQVRVRIDGVRVATVPVTNGKWTYTVPAEQALDAVLLDLNMPGASGLGEYLPGTATGTHFFVQAQLQRFAPSFRGAFISELRGGEQG
jgi:CheY-like chemotaxis protein